MSMPDQDMKSSRCCSESSLAQFRPRQNIAEWMANYLVYTSYPCELGDLQTQRLKPHLLASCAHAV
eukprot:944527-Karenia_brevis.AAC.1